jgi:hypothetical protein
LELGLCRRFRILAIVDDFTRMPGTADRSLPGLRVVRELDFLIAVRKYPRPMAF